jgi:hypothetical protein
MDSRWFKGVKDREARKQELLNYRNAFEELRQILETDFKKKEAVRDYGSPGWANQQIAVNEYNRVLEDVLQLINLSKE